MILSQVCNNFNHYTQGTTFDRDSIEASLNLISRVTQSLDNGQTCGLFKVGHRVPEVSTEYEGIVQMHWSVCPEEPNFLCCLDLHATKHHLQT
jgi:hypothetical protein